MSCSTQSVKSNDTKLILFDDDSEVHSKSRIGLWVAGAFGAAGLITVALSTPFILPALRRHCLPYVPATDTQLSNLSKAMSRFSKKGDSFLDVGSGDGRICRLALRQSIYSSVQGVELNYALVMFSRLYDLFLGRKYRAKYHHTDLWKFPLHRYDCICVFGVESMMDPLRRYLIKSNCMPQTIFACRYPFKGLKELGSIGTGIDTVWIYRLTLDRRAQP